MALTVGVVAEIVSVRVSIAAPAVPTGLVVVAAAADAAAVAVVAVVDWASMMMGWEGAGEGVLPRRKPTKLPFYHFPQVMTSFDRG